jgi:patatin-like phospholipase/acyl hydrolase
MAKLLSLSGGGTSGYMTASLLSRIERELGISIYEEFDMFAGVSTGSIINACLMASIPVNETKQIYRDLTSKVFNNPNPLLFTLFKPLYKRETLKSILGKLLGEMKLCQIEKNFLCYAINLSKPCLTPEFWKSWDEDCEVSLLDAVLASASPPLVFKPHKIGDQYYMDGGIFMNDPTLCAYADMKKMGMKNIKVLSIATDYHTGYDQPEKIDNLITVAKEMANISTNSGEAGIDYIARSILGDNYLYVNPKIYLDMVSEDWTTMDNAVEKMWQSNKTQIKEFFECAK